MRTGGFQVIFLLRLRSTSDSDENDEGDGEDEGQFAVVGLMNHCGLFLLRH